MIKTSKEARWWIDGNYNLIPPLAERKDCWGGALSVGEQQMLGIVQVLLTNPSLIVMNEPAGGLAPAVEDHRYGVFRVLVDEGQSVLLVEQNIRFVMEL